MYICWLITVMVHTSYCSDLCTFIQINSNSNSIQNSNILHIKQDSHYWLHLSPPEADVPSHAASVVRV